MSRLIKKISGRKFMAVGPGGTSLGLFRLKVEAMEVAQKALDDFKAERHRAIEK